MTAASLRRELDKIQEQIGGTKYSRINLPALYGFSSLSDRSVITAKKTPSQLPMQSLCQLRELSAGKPAFHPVLNPAVGFEFWLAQARVRVLYGGRSSSKSWDAGGWAIYLAHATNRRFLCVRQFQNKIEESVYTLLKNQIKRLGLSNQFTVTHNKIIHKFTGSSFVFYGLWRNIDEIKSMEGIDICWIEEAHNLTEEQWRTLDPTLKKQNSEFWIIFNPQVRTDFIYQRFIINHQDNVLSKK